MATLRSKAGVKVELDDANDYIQELEAKLNDILGIAAEAGDEEDSDEEEDSENDEEDDARN